MLESISIVLFVCLVVIILCLYDSIKDKKELKEEISSLESRIEDNIIANKGYASVYQSRIHDVNNIINETQLKNKELKEEIIYLETINEELRCNIKNIRLEVKNMILEKDKQIEELRVNQVNERIDEPCVNENDSNWFKCHCGSEDFIRLSLEEHKGIIGVPPYWEINVQCVKCGGIHKVKNEPYSDKYTHKKSTD